MILTLFHVCWQAILRVAGAFHLLQFDVSFRIPCATSIAFCVDHFRQTKAGNKRMNKFLKDNLGGVFKYVLSLSLIA